MMVRYDMIAAGLLAMNSRAEGIKCMRRILPCPAAVVSGIPGTSLPDRS